MSTTVEFQYECPECHYQGTMRCTGPSYSVPVSWGMECFHPLHGGQGVPMNRISARVLEREPWMGIPTS